MSYYALLCVVFLEFCLSKLIAIESAEIMRPHGVCWSVMVVTQKVIIPRINPSLLLGIKLELIV